MNYASIKTADVANGPGVRVNLFVSGCEHHCKNCFNPETWSFDYGKLFTAEENREILYSLQPTYIEGLTILGGEPLHPRNFDVILDLCKEVRYINPDKTIWIYTGYTYEELLKDHRKEIFKYINVLVDGKFVEELKDLHLYFRGSSNQRLIDIRSSTEENIVLYEVPK